MDSKDSHASAPAVSGNSGQNIEATGCTSREKSRKSVAGLFSRDLSSRFCSKSDVNWVFEQDIRPAARRLLMLTIALNPCRAGVCRLTQAEMARLTGQSERAVRDHLHALIDEGYVLRRYLHRAEGQPPAQFYQVNSYRELEPAESAGNCPDSP